MKALTFLAALSMLCCSCENTWDSETKDMFQQSCLEDANRWATSLGQSKAYCDCVLEKMMKKYPKVSDALEHVDSIMVDEELKSCKTETAVQ